MPKIVDHEARRRDVSEALWRVVRRDGLEAATVRGVAAEAGLSTGAMRHYYSDHEELQRVAMTAMTARVAERVQAVPASGDPPARALATLLELVPVDAERRAEAEAWFSFVALARTRPSLRPVADETYAMLRGLVAQLVDGLAPGLAEEEAAVETERLFALVDGLVLHAVQMPGFASPSRIAAVLEQQLRTIGR